MSARKWLLFMMIFVLISMTILVSFNYFNDTTGYFRFEKGDFSPIQKGIRSIYYRKLKAEYIKSHAKDYDAYILGGSKAGGLLTTKVAELDGYRYYNAYVISGNFEDYYYLTKFIVENTEARKILLHISSHEYQKDNSERGENHEFMRIPVILTGESKINELKNLLLRSPMPALKNLTKEVVNKVLVRPSVKPNPDHVDNVSLGERDLRKQYEMLQKYGARYYENYRIDAEKSFANLVEGSSISEENVSINLQILSEIQEMCDQANVELQVIIGATFISQILDNESEGFYDLLRGIIKITGGYWNFNTFSDINFNPYNFYNKTHYFYETGGIMIDTMNNKKTFNGFGIYLTQENIEQHIQERVQRMEELRKYYVQNKTVLLLPYDHESNIVKVQKNQ